MKKKQFEKIYETYYKDIFIYALSLCKDYYLAETLVSDTFYKALLSIDKEKHIKQWLFLVCKNNYIDYIRKSKKHSMYELNENIFVDETDTLERVIVDEKKRKLFSAISRLDKTSREVITLHYFINHSLIDISNIIGCSYGNVRTIIYRARIKLRIIMEEEYEV